MADDETTDVENDLEGDDPNERANHFFETFGISELTYGQAVRVAIDHATAAGRPNVASPPWVNVGPRNVAGRILSIAQDPKNPLVVWAGSAHGGLWRTIDGGDTWEHVGTPKENFPVATIAIPDDDPTTVYVGTGSDVSRFPGGLGLFKVSAPAPTQPATYVNPPLAAAPSPTTAPASATPGSASHYTRIRMDPYDSRRFWVASLTGLWRYESFSAPPFRLEFPFTGAAPFAAPPLFTGPAPPPGDFSIWPNYACDVAVARDPTSNDLEAGKPRYLFVYVAINGQGVFRGRFDRRGGGVFTWQKKLGPFPGQPASFGRITLAHCRNFPENVYAVFEDTGTGNPSLVQLSSNNGDSWVSAGQAIPAAAQGQADYDLTLEVNPDHPAKLFCGAVELCYSEDSGAHWSQLTVFGRYDGGDHADHSDHHALVFDALDRTRVWSGNDGGLVLADDIRRVPRPRFWRHRSHGIVAGQFNAIDVNPRFPFITGGGLQDNGSWVGFGGPTWMRSGGGDGGKTAFNSGNPRQWVITWQNHADAASVILHVPTVSPPFLPPGLRARVNPTMPDLPIGVMEERKDGYPIPNAPFVPLLVEHPATPGLMLASGDTSSGGALAYWLSSAPPAPPHGTALPPPPLTAPVVGLPGGMVLMNGARTSAVAFGPLINGATDAWIGTDDGQVLVAVNSVGLPTAFALPGALPLPGGIRQVLSDIAVHPSDPRTLAVAAIPDGNDSVTVTFIGPAGPPQPAGTVTFTYTIGGLTGTFGVGGVGGASIVTRGGGAGMILLGTTLVLTFSAANTFTIADTFTINARGRVTPGGGGSTGTITATSTNGQTITIAVATAGAFPGPATFNMSMGGATFSGNPIPMGTRVSLPGTFVEVFFPAGAYVAGSTWTISPLGAVASTGAAGSPLPSAVVNPGGRVYLTWDRGATWTDFSFTTLALPRPNPDLFALPPAPVSALAWNPTATPSTGLIAGTLAGVYSTGGVPAPATGGLLLIPAGPISIRPGAANALQMRVSLSLTSGGPIDATSQVDWSVPAVGAHVSVTPGGLVTGLTAGTTVVTARRGVLSVTIAVTVAAGAPATPPPPAALPTSPAVNPGWAPMNQAIPPNPNNEGLPLTLINDITIIGTRLRVATFGRGIWDAELTPAAQAQRRLYIRQTAVEDGLTYPRTLPVVGVPPPPAVVGGPPPPAPTLATDPRVPQAFNPGPPPQPVIAPTVTLDFTHGFDIRVDTAPFRFFDDRIDGVELEQQVGIGLGAPAVFPPKRPLTATEKAVVYVQVLDSGFDKVDNVDVHLYYFPLAAPVAGGLFPATGVAVPALPAVTDFYTPPNFDPPSPPNPARWRRVAPRRQLARVAANAPAVARFEWLPEAALGGQDVALLAMCTSVNDPLPLAPAGGGAVAAFLQQERRAALRIVSVAAVPATSIYIRDGVDDDGRSGAVAFAGRSPDIVVVQAPPVPPVTPEQAFADLLDVRPQSRLRGGVANTIYVRVHNRSPITADAQVELWALPVEANNQPHATPPGAAPWLQLWPPAGPPPPPLHVPANGWALQPVTWNNPPDPFAAAPAASKCWVLVALVSAGAGDPRPDLTRVDSVDGLWRFLGRQGDSENAAARALRYNP